jgi:hypothetical protein
MKELPDDLAALGTHDLEQQRALRDDALAPLFRRWPALSRIETLNLRRIHGERLRIATYLGQLRRGRA